MYAIMENQEIPFDSLVLTENEFDACAIVLTLIELASCRLFAKAPSAIAHL